MLIIVILGVLCIILLFFSTLMEIRCDIEKASKIYRIKESQKDSLKKVNHNTRNAFSEVHLEEVQMVDSSISEDVISPPKTDETTSSNWETEYDEMLSSQS